MLENVEGKFISSNKPVINIHADYISCTQQFELFYPISPSLALVITKQSKYPDRDITLIDNDEIMLWKKKIVEVLFN